MNTNITSAREIACSLSQQESLSRLHARWWLNEQNTTLDFELGGREEDCGQGGKYECAVGYMAQTALK
jgi:hypothetical protein